jgi:hypothetical protein
MKTSLPCFAFVLLTSQDPAFVERRLSGDLAVLDGGQVNPGYTPSPDGTHVAFSIYDPGAFYVSAADGSSVAVQLDTRTGNGALWSPDGTRLAYSSFQLFSVLADGSAAPLQLASSGLPLAFAAGGLLLYTSGTSLLAVPADGSGPSVLLANHGAGYTLDESGARVVYAVSTSLYSVAVDGSSAPLEIASGLISSSEPFLLVPGGARTIYRAGARLWSTPNDGSTTPMTITPAVPVNREIYQYRLTTDGGRLVFRSDFTTNQTYELYSIPSDGSAAPVRLTPLTSDDVLDFALAPDGNTALYVDQAGRLFSVVTDGGTPPFDYGQALSQVAWESLVFAPDSSAFFFSAGGLFSGPVAGGAVTRVDVPFHDHVEVGSLAVTSDSAYVLYLADDVFDERQELFRLERASGAQGRVSGPVLGQADVQDFRLAPGNRVYWRADSRRAGQLDLFARGVIDSAPPVLLRALETPFTVGKVSDFQARHGRVLFLADAETAFEKELFVVPDDGSEPPRRLSSTSFGTIHSFRVDSAGARAVFLCDANAEGRPELFRVAVAGSSAPERLHPVLEGDSRVSEYALTPDESRVVFSVFVAPRSFELRAAALAGGPSALLASTTSGLPRFALTPDSSAVVFTGAGPALLVSPLDGSAAPLVLVEGAVFSFTTSSERAVYRLQDRLFSVPLTGGTPLEIDDPLPAFAGVEEFELTPDGSQVVYRADAVTLNRFILLVVPADHSTTPRVLNAAMPPGADVASFELTPGGTHALYTVASSSPSQVFAVPLAGGPAVLLGPENFTTRLPGDRFVVLGDRVLGLDGSLHATLPSSFLLDFWGEGERLLIGSPDLRLLSVRHDGRFVRAVSPLLATRSLARVSGTGVVYLDERGFGLELFSSQPGKAALTR